MRSKYVALLALPLAIATGSCYHKTQLAATWHDPQAKPIGFKKTVAVFVTKDEALRRSVEDRIAGRFPYGVPGYRILPHVDSTMSKDVLLAQLKQANVDGAIIMRVVSVTTDASYVPGTYWYGAPYGFVNYWNTAWAYPYDPGYVVTDQIVTVETQVYSISDDKLIFAARSETTNPANAAKLTDSVMRHVMDALKKDGLVVSAILTKVRALAS